MSLAKMEGVAGGEAMRFIDTVINAIGEFNKQREAVNKAEIKAAADAAEKSTGADKRKKS